MSSLTIAELSEKFFSLKESKRGKFRDPKFDPYAIVSTSPTSDCFIPPRSLRSPSPSAPPEEVPDIPTQMHSSCTEVNAYHFTQLHSPSSAPPAGEEFPYVADGLHIIHASTQPYYVPPFSHHQHSDVIDIGSPDQLRNRTKGGLSHQNSLNFASEDLDLDLPPSYEEVMSLEYMIEVVA